MKVSTIFLNHARNPEKAGLLCVYLEMSEVAFLGASKEDPWVNLKVVGPALQIEKTKGFTGVNPKDRAITRSSLRKMEFPKDRRAQITCGTHILGGSLHVPTPAMLCEVQESGPQRLLVRLPEAFFRLKEPMERKNPTDKVKEYDALRQAISIINSAVQSKTARIEVVEGRLVVEARVKFS